MPRYEVLEKCFWNGVLHTPGDDRHGFVVTVEPIPKEKFPKYLKPVKEETKVAVNKAKADAKTLAETIAAAKEEVKGASFLAPVASTVETL